MLISKKNRDVVLKELFKEGVMVCPADTALPKHPHVDVPNLHAIKICQSLHSRGYVSKSYNWRWHYYVLNNTGIEYLREYLHLPQQVNPNTLKQLTRSTRPRQDERARRPRPDSDEKKTGPQGDFKPEFRGGRGGFGGRGRGGF